MKTAPFEANELAPVVKTGKPLPAPRPNDILGELARIKVLFQLRAIEAVIHGPAQGIEARRAETVQQGSVHESPVPSGMRPNPTCQENNNG